MNRSQPDEFQGVNPSASPKVAGDALGILDNQGQWQAKDSTTDPLGALDSPYGGFAPAPADVHRRRMADKMRDAFSLAQSADHALTEKARSDKLVKL